MYSESGCNMKSMLVKGWVSLLIQRVQVIEYMSTDEQIKYKHHTSTGAPDNDWSGALQYTHKIPYIKNYLKFETFIFSKTYTLYCDKLKRLRYFTRFDHESFFSRDILGWWRMKGGWWMKSPWSYFYRDMKGTSWIKFSFVRVGCTRPLNIETRLMIRLMNFESWVDEVAQLSIIQFPSFLILFFFFYS